MKHPFTKAEIECIQQIADGKLQKIISATTGRSKKTIESHMSKARKRIYAANTLHLVAECLRKGWIE